MVAGGPGSELGGSPGKSRSRPRLRQCRGWGSERGVAGGPGQVLHGQPGLEARVHLLLHCPVHWSGFHGNAGVFSFQIRSQRMEKDPGLGARSSGESSLRGRNRKSCSNAPLCFLTLAGRDPTVLLPLAAPRPGSEPPHPRARARGCRRARGLPPSMSVVAPASVAVREQPCCAASSEGTWGRRLHAVAPGLLKPVVPLVGA